MDPIKKDDEKRGPVAKKKKTKKGYAMKESKIIAQQLTLVQLSCVL